MNEQPDQEPASGGNQNNLPFGQIPGSADQRIRIGAKSEPLNEQIELAKSDGEIGRHGPHKNGKNKENKLVVAQQPAQRTNYMCARRTRHDR